jgi:hypothetical protein
LSSESSSKLTFCMNWNLAKGIVFKIGWIASGVIPSTQAVMTYAKLS